MTTKEIIEEVMKVGSETELFSIHDAIKLRQTELRRRDLMQTKNDLKVGDTVRLKGLRNRELNGRVGKVEEIRRTRAAIDLGDTLVPVLIPLTCLDVIPAVASSVPVAA